MSLWLHVTVTNTINKKPLREERVDVDSISKAQPIAEVRIGAKQGLEAGNTEKRCMLAHSHGCALLSFLI